MNDLLSPVVVSIVSGKGGVGKTTLSLAISKELASAGNRVFILDLDLSNRGLIEFVSRIPSTSPQGDPAQQRAIILPSIGDIRFEVVEISPFVYTAIFQPFSNELLFSIEELPFDESKRLISSIISEIGIASPPDIVVLDCHGSRDRLSFAACSLSDDVLVVSTDEIITFSGTRRFLQDFDHMEECHRGKPKFHLVFNNISKGTSTRMLSYWYRRYFQKYCHDENFLTVIPVEDKISIAAPNTLFTTSKYRYSIMAEKTRIVAVDLFGKDDRIVTSEESYLVTKWMHWFVRPKTSIASILIDMKIPVRALALVLVAMYVSIVVVDITLGRIDLELLENVEITFSMVLMWGLGLWSTLVILVSWVVIVIVAQGFLKIDGEISVTETREESGLLSKLTFGVIWRVVVVVAGISIFLVMYRSVHDQEGEKEVLEMLLSDTPIEALTEQIVDLGMAINWIMRMLIYAVSGATLVVFLSRWVRTLLYRAWSVESAYRAGVVALATVLAIEMM